MFIETRGRTFKMSGFPIKRVPKGKVCLIRNFHIINYNNSSNSEVVRQGEISFVPNSEENENLLLIIERCKFESK